MGDNILRVLGLVLTGIGGYCLHYLVVVLILGGAFSQNLWMMAAGLVLGLIFGSFLLGLVFMGLLLFFFGEMP